MKSLVVVFAAVGVTLVSCTGNLMDMGPLELDLSLGTLSKDYLPLLDNDVYATKNAEIYIETEIRNNPDIDPIVKKTFDPITFETNLGSGVVNLRNLVARGGSKFTLNDHAIRMNEPLPMTDPFRADAHVSIPLITADADFDADVQMMILQVKVNGHARVILNDVTLVLAAQAQPYYHDSGEQIYQFNGLEAKILVGKLQVQLSLNLKEFENSQEVIQEALDQVKKDAHTRAVIAKMVLDEANNILGAYSRAQVENYLLQK